MCKSVLLHSLFEHLLLINFSFMALARLPNLLSLDPVSFGLRPISMSARTERIRCWLLSSGIEIRPRFDPEALIVTSPDKPNRMQDVVPILVPNLPGCWKTL